MVARKKTPLRPSESGHEDCNRKVPEEPEDASRTVRLQIPGQRQGEWQEASR